MADIQKPKETSFAYGKAHQEQMLEYYRLSKVASDTNTEYLRVVLADDLVNKYALPRLNGKTPEATTVMDVGCAVGLFAIEYAKKGYRSFGVDFDPAAIEIAEQLNQEEGANAQFFIMDVADWSADIPIDIAICFDIFEHLHDDELGALLHSLKRLLSEDGCIVFHTAPLKYDYLFWDDPSKIIRFPRRLRPFRKMAPAKFTHLVEMYAQARDLLLMLKGLPTHEESIKYDGHCNPLTRLELEDIFKRAGFRFLQLESGFLGEIQLDPRDREYFHRQPVTHRSLSGVAVVDRK